MSRSPLGSTRISGHLTRFGAPRAPGSGVADESSPGTQGTPVSRGGAVPGRRRLLRRAAGLAGAGGLRPVRPLPGRRPRRQSRARGLTYAGRAACVECHDDVAAAREGQRARAVGCEACHGPLAAHAADPTKQKAGEPGPRRSASAATGERGRPAAFPQVDAAEHAGGEACTTCHVAHHPAMSGRRRSAMNTDRRDFLVARQSCSCSPAPRSARATPSCAASRSAAPELRPREHWWAMVIDIEKCIGCGNCVRACKERERRAARAVLLPHLGRALPRRRTATPSTRTSTRPTAATTASRSSTGRRRRQELLRAEAVQPLRALAVRAGLPGGRDLREPGRRGAGRQELLPRLPLLRAGLPVRLPLHRPANARPSTSARSATTASRRG